MPFLAALAEEATLAALILLNVVGWLVALGLLYTWNSTFHYLFKGIADALTFRVLGQSFRLGGWADSIDNTARNWFAAWALGNEILIGKMFHAMAWSWGAMVSEISAVSQDLHSFGAWIADIYLPDQINIRTLPINRKAAAAGAAAAAAALAAKLARNRADHAEHSSAGAAKAAQSAATHASNTAEHTRVIVRTVMQPQTIPYAHVTTLPAETDWRTPFGRTLRQIKKRVGLLEAGVGATAVGIGIANVLGIPNWRCLSKGPIGRVSRALCGMPSGLLNDLLGLLADVWILENVCALLPLLETAASDIGTPLVEALTVAGSGLCAGSAAPGALRGPSARLPSPVTSGDLVLA
jgi:hypothetical protein